MASQETAPTRTTYEANCHCGLVRYSVALPEALENLLVMQDDCSICTHNGYLMVFPKREEIAFHTGYDELKTYQFGNKIRTHLFCPNCGSSLMVDLGETQRSPDLKPIWAVNIRHFRDINLEKIKIRRGNGSEAEPRYDSWIDTAT